MSPDLSVLDKIFHFITRVFLFQKVIQLLNPEWKIKSSSSHPSSWAPFILMCPTARSTQQPPSVWASWLIGIPCPYALHPICVWNSSIECLNLLVWAIPRQALESCSQCWCWLFWVKTDVVSSFLSFSFPLWWGRLRSQGSQYCLSQISGSPGGHIWPGLLFCHCSML